MAAKDDYLIDTMLETGLLASEQVEEGRIEAEAAGEGVLDTLVKKGALDPSVVTMAKATYFGVEPVNLSEIRISDEAIALIPRHVAKKFNVVPVGQSDSGAVIVALSDPSDIDAVDGLRHALNRDVELRVTSAGDIESALGKFYGGG
ncbi:MAG: type II/IV secretion system protein, partial [Verrucomicrobiae bacterium]|nr:type II/IV secretion system protein [Verrucomicrobiae bacterium]